jgi:hypothetical protein
VSGKKMICWVCAGVSFWGAAAVLVAYAIVGVLSALRRLRHQSPRLPKTGMGHPAA